MNPIPQLITDYGSEAKVAAALGVTQPAIHKAKSQPRVSPQMAMRIEDISAGKYRRWEMRPDMWSEPQPEVAA